MTATDPQIWFRLNNGSWFPNGGDPAALTGGISMVPIQGHPFFVGVQGSGDAGISVNFGATAFAGTVPDGFTAGWPSPTGGFSTLDPAKCSGSAGLGTDHLSAGFANSAGLAQSVDGYSEGAFYFELVNPTGDIFSNSWGGGVGRNMSDGGDWTKWFGGEFTSSDNNGAALVTGQNRSHELSSLVAFSNVIVSDVFDFGTGANNIVGVAVFIALPKSKIELQNLQVTTTKPADHSHSFVTMRYSDDGGRRWHEKRTQPMGEIGDFHKNIQFRNLGQGRNKLIEVSWSVPCATSLGGGTVQVEVAGT